MISNRIEDIYSDSNGVLINKLGLEDPELLESAAAHWSRNIGTKILDLPILRIRAWDESLYKELHKTLLGRIYPWAGEYRRIDVGIAFDHTAYEPYENVPAKMKALFKELQDENCFKDLPYGEQIKKLAITFGTLKNLQPFRDGNTRTALLFTELLASGCGLAIDYSLIDRGRFAVSQINARDGDPNDLVMDFIQMTGPAREMQRTRGIHVPRIFADGKEHSLTDQIKAYEEWQKRDRAEEAKIDRHPKTTRERMNAIHAVSRKKTIEKTGK